MLKYFALAAAFAIAAVAPVAAQPAAPYTINVILSMTGPAANFGQDAAASLGAFEKLVNRTGGIRGRQLHFQIEDDQSSPAVAQQLFSQLLTSHPAVVLGPSVAASAQAMAALVGDDGPVMYALTPNMIVKPGSFVFAASVKTAGSFTAVVTHYRLRGLTKIGVIDTTDASGQDNLAGLHDILRLPANKNMQIVDAESFGVQDVSMAAQAAKLKGSGAQVIFDFSEGTAFGTSMRALNDVGLAVPVYTPGANFSPSLLTQLKAILPSELVCTGLSFVNRDRAAGDRQKKPIDDFYAALAADGITSPTNTHAHAWDPALITISVLRTLGPSATAAQIHAAIEGLRDFPGVEAFYDFSAGDQHGASARSLLVMRNDPDHPGRRIVASKQGGAPL